MNKTSRSQIRTVESSLPSPGTRSRKPESRTLRWFFRSTLSTQLSTAISYHWPMRLRATRYASFAAPLLALSVAWSAPNIGFVYPAGGQRGTTLVVSIGGQTLTGANAAYCSIPGVQTRILGYDRPATQTEINNAREKQQELVEKQRAARSTSELKPGANRPVWTADDQRKLEDTREILAKRPNRLAAPAIAETVLLLVTIPAAVQPGDYEFRLRTTTGLSNPLVFQVSDLPESADLVVTGSTNPPAALATRDTNQRSPVKKPARDVTLPTVVNGQIMPGEVDRYRFSARRGQQLVIVVRARDLIPYLADAVPGWFQATVALYDAKGKELAYDDDFRFHPDPVLHFEIPRDGDYFVEIKDGIYRGREDFVYRIALGELPFVTSIFPLGGRVGERTVVELKCWNLPTNMLVAEASSPGVTSLAVRKSEALSNFFPFVIEDWPEVREFEPNNDIPAAQPIALPIVVNGLIDPPGDTDVFQITGSAGDEMVAAVTARRLNSPLDSILKVLDASGRQLALNDDLEDKASGLNTHHADSYLRFKLPAAGKYFIHLGDMQRQGGPEFGYRLRVSAPRPDFELRAVPASLSVRPGGSVTFRVVALRQDGCTNDITVALKDAPRGFKLSGGRITLSTNEAKLTLTAPFAAAAEPFAISLVGRAIVHGLEIIRPVVAAEDQMQAFFYRHLVPAQELQVMVVRRPGAAQRDRPR